MVVRGGILFDALAEVKVVLVLVNTASLARPGIVGRRRRVCQVSLNRGGHGRRN